jgi:hypothetical protein
VPVAAAAVAEAGREKLLSALGLESLDRVVERCRTARLRLGLPVTRWTARALSDVLSTAVFDHGWPAACAVPALLIVAADRDTRSPGRLACAGPWWDAAEGPASARSVTREDAVELAELEARLAEADGARVWVQRLARERLAAAGDPLTRLSVARLACWLLEASGGERAEVRQEFGGGVEHLAGGAQGGGGLVWADDRLGVGGVLDVLAAAPQPAEGGEGGAERGADDVLDGDVAAGGRGAQALVREQRGTGLPGGVVGQDERIGRIPVEEDLSGCEGLPGPGPGPAGFAVRGRPGDDLELPVGELLLDVGLSRSPARHAGNLAADGAASAAGSASPSSPTST